MDLLQAAKATFVIFTFDGKKPREEYKIAENFDESLIHISLLFNQFDLRQIRMT